MTRKLRNSAIRKRFHINDSDLINWSFVLFFSSDFFRLLFGSILARVSLSDFSLPLIWLLIYVPIVLAIMLRFACRKKVNLSFLVILLAVALYFWISILIYPSYSTWYQRDVYGIWDTIFRPDKGGIYGFLFFSLCTSSDKVYKNLKPIVAFNLLFVLYQYMQYLKLGYWTDIGASGVTIQTNYGLTFGYNAAFIACVFLAFYFFEKKLHYLVLGISSIIMMLLQGSRGSIIVVVIFLALVYIKKLAIEGAFKGIVSVAIISIIFLLMFMNLDSILKLLSSFLDSNNLSSRTLNAILSSNLFDDNGRNAIQGLVKSAIENGPFFGHGGFGDRPFIAPYYFWGYCHNIILEFQMDFGKYPGFIMIVILLAALVKKAIQYIFDPNEKFFVFAIILSIFMKLFLSSTFWGDRYFWALLAMLLCWKKDMHIKEDKR